jgi:hypothetical protein
MGFDARFMDTPRIFSMTSIVNGEMLFVAST